MASFNPFYAEWQACLRAHYQHVIREQDLVTEPTLHYVLLETGVAEEEIQRIRHNVSVEIGVEAPIEEVIAAPEQELSTTPGVEAATPESTPVVTLTAEPEVVPLPEAAESVADALPDPIPEAPPKPTRPKPPAQLSLF